MLWNQSMIPQRQERGSFAIGGGKEMGKLLSAIGLALVLVVMPVSCGFPAASNTEVLFDGEAIDGLIGLNFKVYKDRQDVRGIGMRVKGKILVHSNSEILNAHMDTDTSFQVILSTTHDSSPDESDSKRFILEACRLDAVGSLVNNITNEVDFRVYSFTCQGVSGELPTHHGNVTPESLNEWELDSSGLSIHTLSVVTDGSEVNDIKIDDISFEDGMAYQLSSHGYSITTYTFTEDRCREA